MVCNLCFSAHQYDTEICSSVTDGGWTNIKSGWWGVGVAQHSLHKYRRLIQLKSLTLMRVSPS